MGRARPAGRAHRAGRLPLLLVGGVGAGRARGIERDGGPENGAFRDERDAEERPFLAADRPWERAVPNFAGTPVLPHGPDELVVAP